MIRMISAVAALAAAVAAAGAAGPQAERVAAWSSDRNDYNLSFDAGERSLVFARSDAAFKNARIMTAERRGGRWSEAAPIGFSDVRYSDSDPWLTPDGRTLYFVSNRPAAGRDPARKDLDLWRSRRTASGWSAPEHLAPVSSPGPELGPEFHAGYLIFNSVRAGGKGGLDVWRAKALPGGSFAPAEPMPGPFNTAASESDFTLSADGRRAAFWRMVAGKGTLFIADKGPKGWSEPHPLPDSVNIGPFNFTPSFSRDGRRLWFASSADRPGQPKGMADIYVVNRIDLLK